MSTKSIASPSHGTDVARWTRGLFVGTLVMSTVCVAAVGQCEWQTFTPADGLPWSQASQPLDPGPGGFMLEDRRGALWFGSRRHLGLTTRYDGVSWKNFAADNGMALAGLVEPLLLDREGNMWFGSGYPCDLAECSASTVRIARYDGTAWVSYPLSGPGVSSGVGTMIEDHEGTLWAAGDGVFRFDGEQWNFMASPGSLYNLGFVSMIEDRHHYIWVAGYHQLLRFDGMNWIDFYSSIPRAFELLPDLNALLADQDGNIWIGTSIGAVRFDGSSWRLFTTADGLARNGVNALLLERDGSIWFGTGAGASRLDTRGVWTRVTTADGLPDPVVFSMLQDQQGNLWFAAPSGATRWDRSSWRTLTVADSLPANRVRVLEDREGNHWFMSGIAGVVRFDGVHWAPIVDSSGAPLSAWAAVQDPHGSLWFATTPGAQEGGILRHNPDSSETWKRYTVASTGGGLPSDYVYEVAADPRGFIWALTAEGAARFDGVVWRTLMETGSTPKISLYVARNGDVWIGASRSRYSLFHYDGVTIDSIAPLGAASALDPAIQAISEDANGRIWVGTDRFGVLRLDPSGWTQFSVSEGLPGSGVRAVLGDREGGIWVSVLDNGCTDVDGNPCPLGLSRFDGSRWRTVSTRDGLASEWVNFMVEDRSGTFWFSTPLGVSRYEPDRASPQTVITPKPVQLLATRDLTLGFVAAYGETRGVQFSFSEDGGLWSDWAATSFWRGTDLVDGVHEFHVRARDQWGNIDPTPAVHLYEVDATPPLPIIRFPGQGTAVRGLVTIRGVATDSRFRSYRVDVRSVSASSWDPAFASVLVQSAASVGDGPIAVWDTSPLADGLYDLRVAVADSLGLVGSAQVAVIVDNHFPFVEETAPAVVTAASGGDLYTTNNELHLYFPPHAFEQDAVVMIEPAAEGSAPDSLPSGEVRVLPAYDVSWGAAALRKSFTLEFSTAGISPAAGTLALYISSNGGPWRRLGGTLEKGRVSLAVRESGRYALFAEITPTEGPATLSALSFTPRVFSVGGAYANDHVAIGFSLGRSAPVTVRIYNRAGRLMREVLSGQVMGAGANLVRWDGRDREGGYATDGLYLVTVEALGETKRSTLAIVK